MLSPEQCRAARAWLNWSQDELAKRAKVGLSTLKDFEAGKRMPMRNNHSAIRSTLEWAGVAFVHDSKGRPVGITVRQSDAQLLSEQTTHPEQEGTPS